MRRPGGHPVIARLIDQVMAPMDRIRAMVVPQARGRVLEIGVGTGMNLPHYRSDQVEQLVGVDPDPHMRARAERRLAEAALSMELLDVSAEQLPFDDVSFDEVVLTFTLCTIPDPQAALAEMHRVLRPGGLVHFAEHTRSDTRLTACLQTSIDPLYTRFAGGCHLNRDPVALLEASGFEILELHGHARTALNLTPLHRGRARKLTPPTAGPAAAPDPTREP